jgi:uncharacterized delta-60 repeat protein
MKKNLILTTFMLILNTCPVFSQINLQWERKYNGVSNYNDEAKAVTVDFEGNICVTGSSYNSTSLKNITTIKYSPTGDLIWSSVYNGAGNGNDEASLIYTDNAGNVYTAGYSTGSGSSSDYIVIKYNSGGIQQWVANYNGNGNAIDFVTSLAVDLSGNVYITGQSYGGFQTSYDIATVKFNSSGVMQWIARYNGTGNGNDVGYSIYCDNSGSVYVAGQSYESTSMSVDYLIVKYNSDGISEWISKYDGPGNGIDGANSVKTDNAGNVYVTGYSRGSGSLYDYATVKLNSSGQQIWVARHNGASNGNDGANALLIDPSGNIVVSGYSGMSGSTNDFVTVKYDTAGIRQWISVYNGPLNQQDSVTSMVIDDSGNVYVSGFSAGSGTSKDFATVKYSPDGILIWSMRYNGSGNGDDIAFGLSYDIQGNIYVAGRSYDASSFDDFVTLKYSTVSGIQQIGNISAGDYLLYDNYPNPFNPTTQIKFTIPVSSFVKLKVFDLMGKEVETLVNTRLNQGTYNVEFKPENLSGNIYFCRLEAGNSVQTKKMIFLK